MFALDSLNSENHYKCLLFACEDESTANEWFFLIQEIINENK